LTVPTIDGMSANSDAMNAAITSAGQSPASATLDGQTTIERSADDLIKLRNDQATRDNNAPYMPVWKATSTVCTSTNSAM
jgi:hypothetical protein